MRRILVGLSVAALLAAASGANAECGGDCSADGVVTVNELVVGVNIALGGLAAAQCTAVDESGDGTVAVNELVGAVAHLLGGCPFTGQYTAFVDVGDGEIGTIHLQVAPDGQASGTLSVAAAGTRRAPALRIEIPLLNLTGTVDLDSGAYHLTGTAQGDDGPVPVDVSGALPERIGSSGTLQLEIASESFAGTIVGGDGLPTPTATRPVSSPTPTPTAMPDNFPTPGESCQGGSISLVFSAVSGTNSYADLGSGLNIGKANFTQAGQAAFGGGAVPCTLAAGDIIRRVQFIFLGAVGPGTVIPLGRGHGLGTFDYIETPTSNPLGTRGWRADSGSLVVDALGGGMVRFHISGAVMSPEPSFSFQQPATGTLVIDAGGQGTILVQ